MLLYSTNDASTRVSFREAVFTALPKDNGLYLPVSIEPLPEAFWRKLPESNLQRIATDVSEHLLAGEIPTDGLASIVAAAIDFPAPLERLGDGSTGVQNYVLELTHGPSAAFKDFGARFMSGVMGYFLRRRGEKLIILVATSGDTGGAVAAGFHGSDNIDVVILYPKGRVSSIQEAQLTTLGGNVTALRVAGSFDDCQHLVKQAFLDAELRSEVNISSANSINIARLIPQSFYYIDAYRQWLAYGHAEPPVFSVPSGNFGNLTAGVLAEALGLPVAKFVAATNANDTVVSYARTGEYTPKTSVATLSNAMDVGAPSNYVRLSRLLGSTWNGFRERVYAVSFTDEATEEEMRLGFRQNPPYVFDPHTAVGSLALKQFQQKEGGGAGIVLGTAHAAKFRDDVERILGTEVSLPPQLEGLLDKPQTVEDIGVDYATLKRHILKVKASRG